MALMTPGQKLRRARLVRLAARTAVVATCTACAIRPAFTPIYTVAFCLALQAPSHLAAMLRRQSSTGQKRAIGAALCVLGAACAAAAACIVAASDAAPPSSVGATVDHGQRTARGTLGRRKYDPLWWIPSLRVLTAFFSPVAAAAILRFFDRYARGSELPTFGLQTEDEYTAASDAATKRSLGALATELRERGIPPTVSEHARRRLEMLAAGGGQATGLLRSEAMQWVRHAAAPEAERAALAFGFSIGHDGRRIDEGRGSDGSSSDGEMAETSMDREPSRSALRRWDDGNKAVRQGDEPTDEPANWSNVRLIKQVATRVREVTAQRRAVMPAWIEVCQLLEEMWAFLLPGI